jgi:hypothetical protein
MRSSVRPGERASPTSQEKKPSPSQEKNPPPMTAENAWHPSQRNFALRKQPTVRPSRAQILTDDKSDDLPSLNEYDDPSFFMDSSKGVPQEQSGEKPKPDEATSKKKVSGLPAAKSPKSQRIQSQSNPEEGNSLTQQSNLSNREAMDGKVETPQHPSRGGKISGLRDMFEGKGTAKEASGTSVSTSSTNDRATTNQSTPLEIKMADGRTQKEVQVPSRSDTMAIAPPPPIPPKSLQIGSQGKTGKIPYRNLEAEIRRSATAIPPPPGLPVFFTKSSEQAGDRQKDRPNQNQPICTENAIPPPPPRHSLSPSAMKRDATIAAPGISRQSHPGGAVFPKSDSRTSKKNSQPTRAAKREEVGCRESAIPPPPAPPSPVLQPTGKNITFVNTGRDPAMAAALLYYESTPFGSIGHGSPPVSVTSFPGHRWFIVANGVYAKIITVGEEAQQTFSF